jgi:amino acid transporter
MLENYFGWAVPWWVCSVAGVILMFVISYFKVTLTGKILGVALGLEVLVVFFVATAVIVQGGAQGQMPEAFNPAGWLAAPAIGIGFFFAFWSWIGFETTAIYGEETTDPKQSVPRATYIAVITLGVFYTFAAYAGIVGFGDQTMEQAGNLGEPCRGLLLRPRRHVHVAFHARADGLPRHHRFLRVCVRVPQQRLPVFLLHGARPHSASSPWTYARQAQVALCR